MGGMTRVNTTTYRRYPVTRIAQAVLLGFIMCLPCVIAPVLADTEEPTAWSTDVVGVSEEQLSADYWIGRLDDSSQLLMDQASIAGFNQRLFASNPNMVDLARFPAQLPGAEVRKTIESISKPASAGLYNRGGKVLDETGYRELTAKLALDDIAGAVEVQFALAIRRTAMRTYPTDESWFRTGEDTNLDRFQESALFPGDAVAVLHTSADGEWSFVQSYNYAAWVRSENIAIGDRAVVDNYRAAELFLVITGSKVFTNFNTDIPALSELQLDMGTRLPLADRAAVGNNLYGQNPFFSHAVLLPVRNPQGGLEIKPALIARGNDVSHGYIPYTRENIIRQAFKFLGERYGWGHSRNARDCTGFVMEVYKTFGLLMPRNTGQQGNGEYGVNTRFGDAANHEEKLQALRHMDTGDLVYVPGHVLMHIGDVGGEPWVIHDVSVFRYIDANGEYYEGTLNGVSVTPLIPLWASPESPYVDQVYDIKKIR